MRYIIGDVHGCRQELERLCDLIDKQDPLAEYYCVGDLVNKGPDSEGVLKTIKERKISSVLGNHDLSLIKILELPESELNDRQKRLRHSYINPNNALSQLKKLPLWLEFADSLIVHAGLDPRKSKLCDMQSKILTSIRHWDGKGENLDNPNDPKWYECVRWPKKIIFGHWAIHGLMVTPNFICLDSGCVYGKELTAFCLETNEIIQIKAQKVYCQIK